MNRASKPKPTAKVSNNGASKERGQDRIKRTGRGTGTGTGTGRASIRELQPLQANEQEISRLRDEQGQLTLRLILRAVGSELLTKGYDDLSMRGVAKHAGMSVPTVYRYYPNKEALLIAFIDATTAEREFNPGEILATAREPMQAITRLLDAIWDVAEGQPSSIKAGLLALTAISEESKHSYFSPQYMTSLARQVLAPLALPSEQAQKLETIVALFLGVWTWYQLRLEHSLPRPVARAAVLDAIQAVLDAYTPRA